VVEQAYFDDSAAASAVSCQYPVSATPSSGLLSLSVKFQIVFRYVSLLLSLLKTINEKKKIEKYICLLLQEQTFCCII
jgi:hypothetical protein